MSALTPSAPRPSADVSKIVQPSVARLTRSRTSPSEVRLSKMTTRMTRCPRSRCGCCPSPLVEEDGELLLADSFASPPVAAMLPAVSEASEVVSSGSVSARGDQLPVLVDQEDEPGVGVLEEPLDLEGYSPEFFLVDVHIFIWHVLITPLFGDYRLFGVLAPLPSCSPAGPWQGPAGLTHASFSGAPTWRRRPAAAARAAPRSRAGRGA